MTRTPPPVATAALAATLVLLAACSGGGSNSARTAAGHAGAAGANSAMRAVDGAAARAGNLAPGSVAAAVQDAPLASTSLILTASLSITAPAKVGVDSLAARAHTIAGIEGGRVDSDDRSSGAQRTATLVLRVPNPRLADAISRLAALGTVTSRQFSTRDVTSEVADVDSRVTSARAAIASLNRLYARATTVRDVISVETSLAARESDLESLEARQHALAGQTSLATITLDLATHKRRAATHRHESRPGGFVGGLQSGWHALVRTVVALGLAFGAVLPFAVVLLLIAAAVLLIRRRVRRPGGAATISPGEQD